MLVGGCSLVLAAVIAIVWPYEPKYRDQSLSRYLTRENSYQDEAAAAFREVGADSWPLALRFLRADVTSLSWRLRVLLTKQSLVKIRTNPEPGRLNMIGLIGFEALGTNATPAIPELAEMLKQPRYAKRAARALVCTGPASLVVITNRLVDGTQVEQSAILYALTQGGAVSGYMEPMAFAIETWPARYLRIGPGKYSDHQFWLQPVIPYIVRLANDSAMNTSSAALRVMQTWPTNELKSLDYEFLMQSPNWGVRHSVVQWLRNLHPYSPQARSLLVRATNDSYWLVQRSAEDALRTLPPYR
jgi:hypothetical protein